MGHRLHNFFIRHLERHRNSLYHRLQTLTHKWYFTRPSRSRQLFTQSHHDPHEHELNALYRRFFSTEPNPTPSAASSSTHHATETTASATEAQHHHPSAIEAAIHWNREQLRHLRLWQRQFYFRVVLFCACGGAAIYFGWDWVQPKISEPLATLFGETVSHPELQNKTEEVSKSVVLEVLRDEGIQGQTTDFFIDILTRDATMITLEALFKDLFQRPEILAAAVNLLVTTFNNEYVAEQAAEFTEPVMKTAVLNLLQDEEVRKMAVLFLKDVVNDAEIQTHSSDALYKVFVEAFTPAMLSRRKPVMGPELPPELDALPVKELSEDASVETVSEDESETQSQESEKEDESEGDDSDDGDKPEPPPEAPPKESVLFT